MTHLFRVELHRSEALRPRDPDDSTVAEAIESIYPHEAFVRIRLTVDASVQLPVSGGVSDIYNDLATMLTRLEIGDVPFDTSFLCSCFTAKWSVSESAGGELHVRTSWTSVIGDHDGREIRDAAFNEIVPQLVVRKDEFIDAWRGLLSTLERDLLAAGYGSELAGFRRSQNERAPSAK